MDRQIETLHRQAGSGRALSRCLQVALLSVLMVSAPGCQIVIGVMMMLGGRPMLDADFKTMTKKEMTDAKKVVVLCTSPEKAQGDMTALDLDILAEVSRRMRANKINIVDAHKVGSWIDDNGGELNKSDLVEIGRKFKCDYIVHIEIEEFSCTEPNSPNLFRGRAKGSISVLTMEETSKGSGKKRAKKIYDKVFSSTYPVHQPVSSEQRSIDVFRKEFLNRLSDELARTFYDHRPGEDI